MRKCGQKSWSMRKLWSWRILGNNDSRRQNDNHGELLLGSRNVD